MSERVPPARAAVLPPTPDELEHLRPLVRRLVWDPSEVDDVLQEVWLAGQRGLAGIAAGARRSWLATTARRIAGHRRRREGERSDREAWARFGGGSPEDSAQTRESVDQEVERLDALGRLLEALGQLPDLERTAVSLRYLEGLPPRKIAGRIDRSPDQTRQILHRGIKRLRAALDREYRDERRAWIAPLMGVGWPWGWRVGMAATAALLPVTVLAWVVVALASGPDRDGAPEDTLGVAGSPSGPERTAEVDVQSGGGATATDRRSVDAFPERSELSVVDAATGATLEQVELHWAALPKGQAWRTWSSQRSGDAAPWITADERAAAQSIQVLARAAGYASGWWVLSGERAGAPCRLELWPLEDSIGGRVETPSGKPLEDVHVRAVPRPQVFSDPSDPEARDLSRDVPALSAFDWQREPKVRTAADGRWSLAVPRSWTALELRFEHSRYLADTAFTNAPKARPDFEQGQHRMVLNSGRPLRGRVTDAEGRGVSGAEVLSLPRRSAKSRRPVTRVHSDDDGWFEMGVPEGFEGWLRTEGAGGASALARYDAGAGVQLLELPDSAVARLELQDDAGRALADWRLSWIDPGRDAGECWARTDDAGVAELAGLPRGVQWLHAQRGREAANWETLPARRSEPWTWRLPASVEFELHVNGPNGEPWSGPVEVEYLQRKGESLLRRRLDPEVLEFGRLRVTLNADERANPQAWLGLRAPGHRRRFLAMAELRSPAVWNPQPVALLDRQPLNARGDDLRFAFEAHPAGATLALEGVPPRIPAGVERWSWSDAAPADLDPESWVLGWGRDARGALSGTLCVGPLQDFLGPEPPADVRLAAVHAPVDNAELGVRYELRGTQRVQLNGVWLERRFEHVHRPASAGRMLRLEHLLPGALDLTIERYQRLELLPVDEATGRDLARTGAPYIAPDGEAIRLRIAAGGKLVAERLTASARRALQLEAGGVSEIELPR
ncbi:MAG: RNA polymerase sigma factor [Planctomycetota bacterium]|jgi:RNA polymerase sigma-70 factor (ECF subfamily)